MKRIIVFLFTIAVFTACNNGPERWTRTSQEIDATKALVKDYLAGDWKNWSNHYADTAKVFHNTITAATSQQLQDAFKADITNYSSYKFSDKDIYYEMIIDEFNNKWVYFWGTWEGTTKATNQKFIIPVHLALKFVNGKIAEEYGYYNRSAVDAALKEIVAAAAVPPVM